MLYTSAEANKLLKKLNDQYLDLRHQEEKTKTFNAATMEDIETVRPAYDYAKTQAAIAELEKEIRHVKHAINTFNISTLVPGFDMTIDEMLVYIPQLTRNKNKLATMKAILPKERVTDGSYRNSNFIDYCYANYDLKQAEADYQKVSDELAKAQLALDQINSSLKFEI